MYFHWLICRQELKFGCLALVSVSLTYTSLCDQSSFTRLKICRTSSSLKNCLGCDVWVLCSSSCHHLSLCPGSWPCFSSTSSHVGLATGCSSCQEIPGLYSPCQSLEKLRALCIWWSGSLGLPVHAFRWACAGSPEREGQCPSALSYVQLRQCTHPVPAERRKGSRLARSLKPQMLAGAVWDGHAGGFACSCVAHILFNNFFFNQVCFSEKLGQICSNSLVLHTQIQR